MKFIFLITLLGFSYLSNLQAQVNYETLVKQARQYALDEKFDQAIQIFSEAIRLQPKSIDAYLDIAMTYSRAGHTEIAIELLKKMIDMRFDTMGEKNRGGIYLLAGDFFLEQDDHRNAKLYYEQGLDYKGALSLLFFRLSTLELHQKNFKQSWNYFAKALGHGR
jgi:tetratricopeptide (TPR) repeat protein